VVKVFKEMFEEKLLKCHEVFRKSLIKREKLFKLTDLILNTLQF